MLQTTTCCHISKTSTEMELGAQVFPPTEKHVPDLLSKTEKQLQHQIERVRHTAQDQRVESFLGSEQRYWLRAPFTQRHGKDFPMT